MMFRLLGVESAEPRYKTQMEFISGLAQLETEMTGVRQIIYFLISKKHTSEPHL